MRSTISCTRLGLVQLGQRDDRLFPLRRVEAFAFDPRNEHRLGLRRLGQLAVAHVLEHVAASALGSVGRTVSDTRLCNWRIVSLKV